jgi:hypothetical protein
VAGERGSIAVLAQDWPSFREVRDGYLETLGGALLRCTDPARKPKSAACQQREATFEVAYGLTALYGITRDQRYAVAADKAFDRHALKNELSPYAAAWMLAFVEERERVTGQDDLRSEAEIVATDLEAWLGDLDDRSLAQGMLFGSENNVAWALLNLWNWSQHTENVELAARLATFTKTRVLGADMDSWCPLPVDGAPDSFEFLPPCLQRATTVLAVMPEQVSNPWLSEFLDAQSQLAPLGHAALATHHSLNFSRASALWSVYRAKKSTEYRDMYIAHVRTQMRLLHQHEQHGDGIDPWHAAFGVHAIAQSY